MKPTIANFETGTFCTGGIGVGFSEDAKRTSKRFDTPIKTIDKENKRIFVYEAIGIRENAITIEEEFVNRSKEFYLNVNGEYKDEVIEWCNDINIRLFVNTELYNKYAIHCFDGIIIVELHEIENEKPEITRLYPKAESEAKSI